MSAPHVLHYDNHYSDNQPWQVLKLAPSTASVRVPDAGVVLTISDDGGASQLRLRTPQEVEALIGMLRWACAKSFPEHQAATREKTEAAFGVLRAAMRQEGVW